MVKGRGLGPKAILKTVQGNIISRKYEDKPSNRSQALDTKAMATESAERDRTYSLLWRRKASL